MTATRTFLAFVIALCIAALAPFAHAEAPSPWQDARLKTWSTAYRNGQLDQLLKQVEADLKSKNPHLFSPHVWVVTQDTRGTLDQAIAALDKDPALKAALGIFPDVYTRYQAGKYEELLAAYPPSKTAALHEYWPLTYLAWAGGNIDPYTKLDYLEQQFQLSPDFWIAWEYKYTVVNYLTGDPQVLARARAFAAKLPNKPVSEFLLAVLGYAHTNIDELDAVERVLRAEPWNRSAMSYKAQVISSDLKAYSDAAELYRKADIEYPWLDVTSAKQLMLAGRRAEADRALADHAKRYPTTKLSREQRLAHDSIARLMDIGERGQAKHELDAAVAKWPKDAWLYDQLYQYWSSPNDVEPARRAVELEPTKARRESLVHALLTADKLPEAEAVYEALAKEGFKDKGAEVYAKLKKTDELLRWWRERVTAAPKIESRWRGLAEALGEAGNTKEAIDAMLHAYTLAVPTRGTLDELVKWYGSDGATADKKLAELRDKFPWQEDIAHLIADRMAGEAARPRRIAFYAELEKTVPGRDWPWQRHVWELIEAQRWDEAAKVAEQERAALASATNGERAMAALTSAWVIEQRARYEAVPDAIATQALEWLHQYEVARGDLTVVMRYRFNLLNALHRMPEACEAGVKRSALEPDDSDLWWKLMEHCSSVTPSADRLAAKRFLDRNPDDPDRLDTMARASVYWWGADVLALGYVDRIRKVAPARNTSDYEGMALQHLGDGVKSFELQYGHEHSLANSNRYIDWYENARSLAEGEENNIVEYDSATSSARITYSNGDVVSRRDHPVSGKIQELRRGQAAVRATYDENGQNLQRIEAGGLTITLDYDKTGSIKVITSVVAGQVIQRLSFEYNAMKKPVVMEMHDFLKNITGAIHVEYEANGEIKKVESWPKGSRTPAIMVTAAFGQLQSMLSSFDTRGRRPPRIPFPDFDTAQLRYDLRAQQERAAQAPAEKKPLEQAKVLAKRVELVQRLVALAPANTAYDSEAREMLDDLIDAGQQSVAARDAAITAVGLYNDLLTSMRPNGVTTSELVHFAELTVWVRKVAADGGDPNSPHATAIVKQIAAHPIDKLLPSERLLQHTDLANEGLWTVEPLTTVLPPEAAGATVRTALVRNNGDVVVGTSRGLLVRAHGVWSHQPLAPDGLEVRALAETATPTGTTLWIGTARGMYVLDEAGAHQREAGPRSPITALVGFDHDSVIAGTEHGALLVEDKRVSPLDGLRDETITALSETDGTLAVATTTGTYVIATGQDKPALVERAAATATRFDGNGTWTLVDGRLIAHDNTTSLGGLANMRARSIGSVGFGGGTATAVVAESGVWLDVGSRFEQLPLASATGHALQSITSNGDQIVVLADDAILTWQQKHVVHHVGRVDDLLTLPSRGITLATTEGEVIAIDHASPRDYHRIPGAYATFLAKGATDDFVLLAGYDGVSQLDVVTGTVTRLFEFKPTLPSDDESLAREGKLTSVLAASDGSVWATAGASLYHWKNGATEEFSTFKDPVRFPSRSEMLARVVETVDHRIWVVASDESHIPYHGVPLSGGLLQLEGDKFVQLGKPGKQWFLSGYTPIDSSHAVVGSTQGFALHDGARLASFYEDANDQSYIDIVDKQNRGLFLGTRGVAIGANTWIFGTASGVVAYSQAGERSRDRWTLLEHLNALLPDGWLLERGGRVVHAVETDARGRIYVGTDRGLLVVEGGLAGLDASSAADLAFAVAARTDAAHEAAHFKAPTMAEATKLTDAEQQLQSLLAKRAPGVELAVLGKGESQAPTLDAGERAKLDGQIEAQRKQAGEAREALSGRAPALAEITGEDSPVDVAAIQARLKPNEAFVRYLATTAGLLVEVVEHERVTMRNVRIPGDELEKRAAKLAWLLDAERVGGVRAQAIAAVARASADSELAWLYSVMVQPIEPLLGGKRVVYVLARGGLRYVPLGALIRSKTPHVEYAAERYVFAYVDSEAYFRGKPATAAAAVLADVPAVTPNGDGSDLGAKVRELSIGGSRAIVVGAPAMPKGVGAEPVVAAEAVTRQQREAIHAGAVRATWATVRVFAANP